jgi:hypothetical protein
MILALNLNGKYLNGPGALLSIVGFLKSEQLLANPGGDRMNNKRLMAVLTSACLVLLVPPTVAAEGFNYTYMEGGYRNLNADSIDADGFEAGFSFGVTDYIHILGRYSRLFVDDLDGASDVDLDIDEFKIGFGGNYPIMDKVDLVLDAVYVDEQITGKARLDGGGFVTGTAPKTNVNDKNEGYEATFSARVQALKKLEMTPHVVYRDVGSESGTGFGLGLIYNFHKQFSLRVRGTRFSDDSATNLFLGMRVDM